MWADNFYLIAGAISELHTMALELTAALSRCGLRWTDDSLEVPSSRLPVGSVPFPLHQGTQTLNVAAVESMKILGGVLTLDGRRIPLSITS